MRVSLSDWTNEGRLRAHRTSRRDVADLFSVADLALRDAELAGLLPDRAFFAAYDAARALATVVLAAAGYRPDGVGQHSTTFLALPQVMGKERSDLAHYLDACRAKRNVGEYRRAGLIRQEEVQQLAAAARELREQVVVWLRVYHPHLLPAEAEESGE